MGVTACMTKCLLQSTAGLHRSDKFLRMRLQIKISGFLCGHTSDRPDRQHYHSLAVGLQA